MLVLALDTTTRQGSVALAREGSILASNAGDAAIAHGARLPGDLARVLDALGVRIADVDLFAVAVGPGSFTGLRIGIATMQGLALGNSKPLAGVSALDAIHEAVGASDIAVWMDAGRGQVFSAIYQNGENSEAALVDKPAAILARWASERTIPRVFAGDGAIAYGDLIRAAIPSAHIVDPAPLLAPSVARLAEAQVREHGPASPDAVRPVYIRRPDVELARERQADLKVSTTKLTTKLT